MQTLRPPKTHASRHGAIALFALLALLLFTPPVAFAQSREAEARSAIVMDSRLYDQVGEPLETYARLAGQRRGFRIIVDKVEGIDDWTFDKVKEHLKKLKSDNKGLEGILLVGNIKLPSFYSPRADNLQTRCLPLYYHDFEMKFEKLLKAGDKHTDVNGKEVTAPEHDFDRIEKGDESGLDLWIAFLPVGLRDAKDNTYENFGKQINGFLKKAVEFHSGKTKPPKRLYKVSNQLWDISEAWDYYGPKGIDFYAMNPKPKGSVKPGTPSEKFCALPPDKAYVRVPMEKYKSFKAFQDVFKEHEWMGEGWQKDTIFIKHMDEGFFDFVWVNVHSWEQGSLISSEQARKLTGAGLVMLMAGCGVGGFCQPGSKSFVDSQTAPADNVLLAFVYGQSKALAALGDPFDRGHECYFEKLIGFMVKGDYLGKAYLKRMRALYDDSSTAEDLKENMMEILVGDPYMDIVK